MAGALRQMLKKVPGARKAYRVLPNLSHLKEIIKSLAEPAQITRGDGIRGISSDSGKRILLAAESLSGWQIANCPN